MTIKKNHAYLLVILLIIPYQICYSQFSGKINLESGFYNSTQQDSIKQNNILLSS